MAVETSAARLIFLADFGLVANYTKSGGGTFYIKGIFDNEFYAAETGAGVAFVSAQPRFFIRSEDLPSGADYGDSLAVDGVSYTVRVIQPDGTGMTTLLLEKA